MNLKRYFITLGITLGILLLLSGVAFFSIYNMLGGKWTVQDMGQLFLNPQLPGKTNILLIGTDKDETRADVMIVLMLDPKTNKINLVSVPRDTRVYIAGQYYKLNATMGFKEKEKMSISEVQKLLGININNYVRINFQGFRNCINILGGVDFDVPRDMFYEDPEQNLHINLKKGPQHLDGDKAEQLVRFRRYLEGDVDRIRMQQSFLQELFKQKLNAGMIAKAPQLLGEISKNVKTDIPTSDYPKYLSLVTKMSKDDLIMHETPGEGKYIGDTSYFLPDMTKLKAMMQEINSGTAPSPSESPSVSPKVVKRP